MAEDILIPLGGMVMVGWLAFTIVDGIRRWHQQRMLGLFQAKLLDKIGSVNELGVFLNTEAGVRLLKGLTSEAARPEIRILRAVQSGVVLAALGTGLYMYGWFTPTISGGTANAINAIATILFSLGLGFVAAAGLSHRLSRQMGLLDADNSRSREQSLPTA